MIRLRLCRSFVYVDRPSASFVRLRRGGGSGGDDNGGGGRGGV